jgi:hypothetical protein
MMPELVPTMQVLSPGKGIWNLNCRTKYAIMDGIIRVLLTKWIRTNAQAAQVSQVRQRWLVCAYK